MGMTVIEVGLERHKYLWQGKKERRKILTTPETQIIKEALPFEDRATGMREMG